jgi:Bacterial regulatory proteins, gntR family
VSAAHTQAGPRASGVTYETFRHNEGRVLVTGSLRKRDRAREHLLGLVESRAVGQAIPSERQLSAELEISRPTLRAVVDDLVRAGWLVREHGRS